MLQVLTLLGGLGLFLFGMRTMSAGLQKVAGARLRGLLAQFTRNRFTGITSGFLIFYLVFLLYGGFSSTHYALQYGQRNYSAWGPPIAPIKIIMTIAIALMLLQVIATFFKDLAKASTRACFLPNPIPFVSAMRPALAPPKGSSMTAHFQVMVRANRATSSTSTVGVILIPPLPGPKVVLSMTTTPLMPASES